jgi:hypothetical protein
MRETSKTDRQTDTHVGDGELGLERVAPQQHQRRVLVLQSTEAAPAVVVEPMHGTHCLGAIAFIWVVGGGGQTVRIGQMMMIGGGGERG